MQNNRIYLVLLLQTLLPSNFGLQVFDCTDPTTQYEEISLKEIGACSQVGKNYLEPKPTEVQIIKRVRSKNFEVNWCRVKVDIDTYVCGYDGYHTYSYPGQKASTNEVIEVSKEECENAHRSGKMTINLGDLNLMTISFSHSRYASDTKDIKGFIERDTSCEGEDYKFRGRKYKNSILRVRYTAEIGKVHAIYNADEKMVAIPNKIRADADAMYVYDMNHGTYSWMKEDLTHEMKCDNYQEVISGTAQIYNPVNDSTQYEPIILLEDDNQGRHAAILKGDPTGACGEVVYQTQLEDIFLVMLGKGKEKLKVKEIDQLNTDKFLNIEGLISLTHLSSELRISDAFSRITGSICEANKLRLEESVKNFAANGVGLTNRPEGTISVKAGSSAYVFKCAPVEAELRFEDHDSCTHEIPIWLESPEGRIPKFADPVSLVVLANATVTICSPISPIKWALPHPSGAGYDWFCSTPIVTKCAAPTILDPMLIKNSVFNVKSRDLKLSFYDKVQLQNLAKFQSMGNVRDAITTRLTHDVLSSEESPDIGYNILKGIPTEQLNKIKEELTPWLARLGWLWDAFGHFIIAYFITKIIIRFVLLLTRIRRLVLINGSICSPKIFHAFTTELFLAAINSSQHNCCPCSDLDLETLRSLSSETRAAREDTGHSQYSPY